MKKMSRLLALVMALVLALGSFTTAMAEDSTGYALGDLTAGLLQGWSDAIWGHYANEFYNELKATTTEEEYNTVMASHSTAVAEKLISSMTEEQRADLFAHNVDLSAVNGEAFSAFNSECQGVGLSVDVPDGLFPTGTELIVDAVSNENVIKAISDAVSSVADFMPYAGYDITFEYSYLNKTGELQPAGSVPLTFSVPTSIVGNANELIIYHLNQNGDGFVAEQVGNTISVDRENEIQTITANVDSFSIYVVAGDGTVSQTPSSTVTLEAGHEITLTSDYQSSNASWSEYTGWGSSSRIEIVSQNGNTVTIRAKSSGTTTLRYGVSGSWGSFSGDTIQVVIPYTVTFDPNGGDDTDGTANNTIKTSGTGGEFTFPSIEQVGFVAPDGMQFAGWSTNNTGKGNTYSSGVEGSVSSNSTVFYALWYDPNVNSGGTQAYFHIRLDGQIPYEPSTGWPSNYSDSHGLTGTLKTAVSINNNLAAVKANILKEPTVAEINAANVGVTIPAGKEVVWYVIKWNPTSFGHSSQDWHVDGIIKDVDDHLVIYDPNGGDSNVTPAMAYTPGVTVDVNYTNIPARAGWTFLGWDEDKNATTPTYVQGGNKNSFTMPDRDVTLYAIWKANDSTPYTVKHYLVSADNSVALKETENLGGKTGSTVVATPKNYAGYTYQAGYSNGTNVELKSGEVLGDGSLELKLFYTEDTVTINYVAKGPEGAVNFGSVDPTTNNAIPAVTGTAAGSTPTAGENYAFAGWFTDENCQNAVTAADGTVGADNKFVPAKEADGAYEAATFYAKFVEQTANINYVRKLYNNSTIVDLTDDTIGTISSATETVNKVTGDALGSTATVVDTAAYEFEGWYNDASCAADKLVTENAALDPAKPDLVWPETTTYYALFHEKTVTINYEVVGPTGATNFGTVDLNDGVEKKVEEDSETVNIKTGDPVGATAAAASNTYKFVGWYSDPECKTLVSTDASYDPQMVNGLNVAATYYAKFDWNVADMTITKTVVGTNDTVLNDGTPFTFTVNFYSSYTDETTNTPSTATFDYVVTNADDEQVKTDTISHGGELPLQNGQMATIKDVTIGTTVITKETALNGYVQKVTSTTTPIVAGDNIAAFTNVKVADLTVSKEIEGVGADKTKNFTFTVALKCGEGEALTGVSYTKGGNQVTLPADGTFTLTNGESITIKDLPVGTKYTVTETSDNNYDTTYSLDGAATVSALATGEKVLNDADIIAYTNSYKQGSLTITKSGWQEIHENQTFRFHVKGTETATSSIDMYVMVTGNGSVTINDLPFGKYTVKEDENWSWRYEDKTGELPVDVDGAEAVTIVNSVKNDKWLDNNAINPNVYNGSQN